MDKHRGFILYAVLVSLLIATLLALALAKATLLHQKINQQFNNGRLTQLEALNGIYYVSQSNPLRLADTWKILTVPGPWPDDIVTEAKLRHLQFLPDTLSFLETQGDDVYGLSVRSRNQNNDIKAWHVTWWQRDNSVSYQYLGLSAPVIIGQFPLSRYADRLKASPDLLSRYRVYQQQVETQEALAYQIDTRGYLQVRAFKTGKRIWQEKLAKPEAGQSARLSAADVYVDHAWHTVLLAIIGNQVWLFDTTGRIQHSLSCWWHVKTNNAQQFSGTLFQAGNGQWLVMLSLSSKLSRIQFLALKNGRLVSQIPLAADSHALTPPVVIDYQQNLVGNWAYVGDERGRLWAINLAGAPGSWHSATVIFNAEDQQHQVQSIQKAPAIAVSGQAQIAIYLLAGNAAHSAYTDCSCNALIKLYGVGN